MKMEARAHAPQPAQTENIMANMKGKSGSMPQEVAWLLLELYRIYGNNTTGTDDGGFTLELKHTGGSMIKLGFNVETTEEHGHNAHPSET